MNIIKRVFLYLTFTLLSLLVLLWISSPWIIRPAINELLTPYKISLHESSSIRVNPFNASISINQISLQASNDKDVSLEHAIIDINLAALFSRTLSFDALTLKGINLVLRQTPEGLFLSDIKLSSTPPEVEPVAAVEPAVTAESQKSADQLIEENSEEPDYKLFIPKLIIEDAVLAYHEKNNKQQLTLKQLILKNVDISQSKQMMDVSIKGDINQAPFSIESQLDIQSMAGTVHSSIDLEKLDLQSLPPLAADKLQRLEGLFSLSTNIDIQLSDKLSNIQVSIPQTELSAASLLIESAPFQYATESQTFNLIDIVINKSGDSEPHIQLGQLKLKEPTVLSFTDSSVSPAFNSRFELTELTTGAYDNRTPGQESPFRIVGTDTEYANFTFEGWSMPFAKKVSLKLLSNIKEISLPMISPYVAKSLGLELKTGQFDTATEVSIAEDLITGNSHLFIRGLQLDKASHFDKHELADGKALSLNAALSILQDDQGNITLEIPLSGDINAPDFGIQSVTNIIVKKAIMAAAKDYLITAFVPYANVVKVVSIAGSYALKVNIEPLIFSASQLDLNKQQTEYLDQLALLINDSKDKQIKACAFSDASDINASAKNLDSNQIQQLATLSEARIKEVKSYLVNKGNVSSARILLCTHAINAENNAQPQIQFLLE